MATVDADHADTTRTDTGDRLITTQRRYHRRMTMIPVGGPAARQSVAPAAALFHSLADPVRLVILQRLARGEARVVDLTEEIGLAQSTVSKHLACLRDCGLVESRAAGRASYFSVSHPDAVLRVFAAAEGLLAATGDAVVLCPTYGEQAREGAR